MRYKKYITLLLVATFLISTITVATGERRSIFGAFNRCEVNDTGTVKITDSSGPNNNIIYYIQGDEGTYFMGGGDG